MAPASSQTPPTKPASPLEAVVDFGYPDKYGDIDRDSQLKLLPYVDEASSDPIVELSFHVGAKKKVTWRIALRACHVEEIVVDNLANSFVEKAYKGTAHLKWPTYVRVDEKGRVSSDQIDAINLQY